MKKHLLVLTAFVILQSQTMHKDPRVGPEMMRIGLNENHLGISKPQIQPDGKKIYFAKGRVNGAESLVMVRYNADDTLDTSFGQNGVASEPVASNVFITKAVDMHSSGERLIGVLIKSTMDIRVQENDSCLLCIQDAKEIGSSNLYLTSCCKKVMCHPCYIELLSKVATIKCPNCRNEKNFQLTK